MKRIAYIGLAMSTLALRSWASAQNASTGTSPSTSVTPSSGATTSASAASSSSATPVATAVPSATAQGAQAQDQPLGDFARKIHSKDADAPTPKAKVFDNDNLPMDDKISVVGQAPDASSTASVPVTKAGDGKDASKGSGDDDAAKKQAEWKGWQDKISGQKNQIDLASRELDVLQREYQLRAAEIYADAGNRLRNSADWDKKDAEYKQQIADKQKAVDDAKQKLNDMQEEAHKAGVPSSMTE
jgi:hypothetical protein